MVDGTITIITLNASDPGLRGIKAQSRKGQFATLLWGPERWVSRPESFKYPESASAWADPTPKGPSGSIDITGGMVEAVVQGSRTEAVPVSTKKSIR